MLDASAHFFQTAIFPASLFSAPESRYFFSVESTPENSRRHLVAELLITGPLRASCPILRVRSRARSSFSIFFPFFFFFILRPRISTYVHTYVRMHDSCNRRIPRARLLGTNERNAAVCMVSPGERRRVASPSRRWNGGARRRGGEGRGLQDYIDAAETPRRTRWLEDHPARQYEITFVRQRLRPLSTGSD